MSAILIKDATIVDSASKHHLKKRDVLIENGIITNIATRITHPNAKEIKKKNLHI